MLPPDLPPPPGIIALWQDQNRTVHRMHPSTWAQIRSCTAANGCTVPEAIALLNITTRLEIHDCNRSPAMAAAFGW